MEHNGATHDYGETVHGSTPADFTPVKKSLIERILGVTYVRRRTHSPTERTCDQRLRRQLRQACRTSNPTRRKESRPQ